MIPDHPWTIMVFEMIPEHERGTEGVWNKSPVRNPNWSDRLISSLKIFQVQNDILSRSRKIFLGQGQMGSFFGDVN